MSDNADVKPVVVVPPCPDPPRPAAATPAAPVQDQVADPSIRAETTFQQDLIASGQRHINAMWERTQQIIAISVSVGVTTVCSIIIVSRGVEDSLRLPAFMFLTNISLLVIQNYFQRTNHTKIGGVGPNERGR